MKSRARRTARRYDSTCLACSMWLRAEGLMPAICASVGAPEYTSDANLGKVSIVGVGIQTAPGYAARMFRAMSDAGINIELISTSEIRLTCIIDSAKVPDAVRALHAAFQLETAE